MIGQTKQRSASAAIGGSLEAREYSYDAYIPLDTFRQRVGDQIMTRTGEGFNFRGEIVELTQITLTLSDIAMVDETTSILERLLGKYHDQEDYAIVVPKELLRQAERTRSMFNAMLVIIAGISLLVGGIGFMNIMLATVTERTRSGSDSADNPNTRTEDRPLVGHPFSRHLTDRRIAIRIISCATSSGDEPHRSSATRVS